MPTSDPTLSEAEEDRSSSESTLDRKRRLAGAVLAPLAFALTYWLCDGLTPEGRKLAAILAGVVIFWVCETVPLPVTALLGALLCILLGVAPIKPVLAHFADPIVFLFLGSFMLARAMTAHRLDRRLALTFLSVRWISAGPARLLAGVGGITAVLSMWVSNTATTAMMLPIALGILGWLHRVRVDAGLTRGPMNAREWPYATGMMLMVAYAASIGGIGTPIGSPPNLIGIGLIRNSTGVDIPFLTWMVLAAPMLLVTGAVLVFLLYRLHPASPDTIAVTFGGVRAAEGGDARGRSVTNDGNSTTSRSGSRGGEQPPSGRSPETERGSASAVGLTDHIERERASLGPWTRGEINTVFAFSIAVLLWILPGVVSAVGLGDSGFARTLQSRFPEAAVALLAALLLFLLPVNLSKGEFTLTWSEAVQIDWGTILLFGGGLTLGTLMFETGVAEALGTGLTGLLGASSLWALTFAVIPIAILLSETSSNTAAASMVIPVVIAIAQAAGVNPVPPALGACFGASYGFMLPVSTPPNAIVYGTGMIPIPRMIRAGFLFDLFGVVVIFVGLRIMCPLLGLD